MSAIAPLSAAINPTVLLHRWPDVAGEMPSVPPRPPAWAAGKEEPPRVLGIDLSHRRTALCVILPLNFHLAAEHARLCVRAWSVGADLKKDASVAARWERMHLIAEEVQAAIWHNGISHVAIEGPAFGLPMGMHLLGELSGVVKHAIFTRRVPSPTVTIVPPMQARKALIGRATKGKTPVGQYAKERWGLVLPPDEADAFAVANWMWTRLAGWGFGPTQIEIDEIARALKVKKDGGTKIAVWRS